MRFDCASVMLVYACSTNAGKLREFAWAAEESGLEGPFLSRTTGNKRPVRCLQIKQLPGLRKISPPDETGASFEENASAKALYYSGFTREIVLADDSGLEVEALAGAPGIQSARYAGPEATDKDNNNLLLRDLGHSTRREARYVCVLALARAGRILMTAGGVVEGTILVAPQGGGGFGYDPLFFYPPLGRSFAELTPSEKFAVSHRGNALRALLQRLPEVLAVDVARK